MKGKIFTSQQVKSMIAGDMIMFREVIKPQPNPPTHIKTIECDFLDNSKDFGFWNEDREWKCPYQAGQKIFCKESFFAAGDKVIYKADYESYKPISPWKRSMKQEHSRLPLLIKEIRVERLADISEEDAIAEGFKEREYSKSTCFWEFSIPSEAFKAHWNATHKKPEEKFEASPFVWVVSCEVVK
jgi:hypothetical protein